MTNVLRATALGLVLLAPGMARAQGQIIPQDGSAARPFYTQGVAPASGASSQAGIVPVTSIAVEASHVLKSTPGNLYGLSVTTGGTAGYLLLVNGTAAPASGAVTPEDCYQVAANVSFSVGVGGAPPLYFPAGIVALFSATGCLNYTPSATAWFSGKVQ